MRGLALIVLLSAGPALGQDMPYINTARVPANLLLAAAPGPVNVPKTLLGGLPSTGTQSTAVISASYVRASGATADCFNNYGWTADTDDDTCIYRRANDSIGVATNGITGTFWSSSGTMFLLSNVGMNLADDGSAPLKWNTSTGRIAIENSARFTGHVEPATTLTYDLGTSTLVWDDLFVTKITPESGGTVDLPALAGTAGSGTGFTANNTAALQTVVHAITITEAALTAAATTQDITLWTVAAKTKIQRVVVDVTATFTGGSITDFDVTCGKTAGGNQYLLSFDIDTATGTFGDADAELGTSLAGGIGDIPSWSATTAIQCRFTAVGDNVVNATTGSLKMYIEETVYP